MCRHRRADVDTDVLSESAAADLKTQSESAPLRSPVWLTENRGVKTVKEETQGERFTADLSDRATMSTQDVTKFGKLLLKYV